MTRCEQCHQLADPGNPGFGTCTTIFSASCKTARLAYLDGLRAGVRIARENVRYCDANVHLGEDIAFDWADVDAKLAEFLK